MRIFFFLLLLFHCIAGVSQPFGAGNIVLVRIGAGDVAVPVNVAQRVFLDEYTVCGQLVRSIALPDTVLGLNKGLTLPLSTSDYTEGYINLSADGQYLALAGYNAKAGTKAVTATTSATVNRVVAVIDGAGNVNTSTSFSNRFISTSIRSAVINGNDIWATGGASGVVHASLGSTGTNSALVTTTTGRVLGIYDGQLYGTSSATSLRFVKVGMGLPIAAGATMANEPGYPFASGSPYQFFMAHSGKNPVADLLYVADNNLLKKYSLVGGAWVSNGNGEIGTGSDKYRGLTGVVFGNDIILYAIRRNDNGIAFGGDVVKLIDNTGYNGSFTAIIPELLVQPNANKVFRSIAMAPQQSTVPLSLLSFTGNLVNKQVLLKWTAANELNNGFFIVQQSTDGRLFTDIGKVFATNEPAAQNKYNYVDGHPAQGVSYYRLQQVDKDGKSKTYAAILIDNNATNQGLIMATANGNAQVVEALLTLDKTAIGNISIYDISGRLIAKRNVNAVAGTSKYIISVPTSAPGMYVATFVSPSCNVLTGKFIR